MPAQEWWRSLQRSYAGQGIEFRDCGVSGKAAPPRELFDSAADNLIQNALAKRRLHADFAIEVSFTCGETARLEVCDGGHAIALGTARELLRGPVPSDGGLGIGLYQVARHAEACGFSLELAHNVDRRVVFVLSGPLKPVAAPAVAPDTAPSRAH